MNKYLKEYEWSNIGAMLRNNKVDPKECSDDFRGKLVVLSGATSGIGYHTARLFAEHGANLLLINRNEEKSRALCAEIAQEYGVSCEYRIADYSRLSDVYAVGEELARSDYTIDVLIHNAGVYLTKLQFTDDGIEEVFQVNYLASFILNYLLMDKLQAQDACRIIYVNSEGHRFAIGGLRLDDLDWKRKRYSGLRGYGSAKTAQLLSLIEFSKRFSGSGVTINAMHPGNVITNMGENNGSLYRAFKHRLINPSCKSPVLSAKALYFLAVSDKVAGVSGRFFNFTTEEIPAPHALDAERAEELWKVSLKMGGFA